MSSAVLLFISALVVTASVCAARRSVDKVIDYPTCDSHTQDLSFNGSEALGTWHLLHYTTETENGTTDSHCVEFSPVTDEDRKYLFDFIGKYVENLTWENLVLKMQIPCTSDGSNRIRNQVYYLENLESQGSYRTLQVPSPTAKLDLADFHRYPMRLKMINKLPSHLGMMDCHEKLSFLLGRQPPPDAEFDDHLKYLFHKCIKC